MCANIVFLKRSAIGPTCEYMVNFRPYITAYEIWSPLSTASYKLDR